MNPIRSAIAALLLLLSTPLFAGINYQDMWWKPTEGGWGLMILQQEDTVSAVMFHYRPDRKPLWYLLSSATRASGEVFTGTLIETDGSPLFGAYDPTALTTRNVGSMTITFSSPRAAVVDYTINGRNASKVIERITFATTATAGDYLGSWSGYATCPSNASIDMFTFASHIVVSPARTIRITTGGSLIGESLTCDWTAPLTQTGAILTGSGTSICKNSANQTRMTAAFVIDEMRVIDKSIVINYHATSTYPTVPATCTERGVFSGIKR